jgi:hypothetical protein
MGPKGPIHTHFFFGKAAIGNITETRRILPTFPCLQFSSYATTAEKTCTEKAKSLYRLSIRMSSTIKKGVRSQELGARPKHQPMFAPQNTCFHIIAFRATSPQNGLADDW